MQKYEVLKDHFHFTKFVKKGEIIETDKDLSGNFRYRKFDKSDDADKRTDEIETEEYISSLREKAKELGVKSAHLMGKEKLISSIEAAEAQKE